MTAESHEKPPIVTILEKEIQTLKERLDICEDALRELWEYYQKLGPPSS